MRASSAVRGLRVYIAGPYTAVLQAEVEKNVAAAIDAGIQLLKLGHVPFIPHLTHYVDARAREIGHEISWEEYIQWDIEWLKACDALLYLGSSKGADMELRAAVERGLRIFRSLDEISQVERATLAPVGKDRGKH